MSAGVVRQCTYSDCNNSCPFAKIRILTFKKSWEVPWECIIRAEFTQVDFPTQSVPRVEMHIPHVFMKNVRYFARFQLNSHVSLNVTKIL
jgi:hypothetical protein